jgi:hypothetical protein
VSLKLIELQVALPRTMDAGKTANDLLQKGLIQQEQTSEINRKNGRLESKKVTNKGKADQSSMSNKDHESSASAKADKNQHPFKGLKIDYSG